MAAIQGFPYLAEALANIITNILGATTRVKFHLIAAPWTPQPTTVLSGLTEATFDGYAALAVTSFETVHQDAYGQALANPGIPLAWTPTGSTTPNTIFGYIAVDPAGNTVQSELFPSPVLLDGPTTTLQFVAGFAVGKYTENVVMVP